MDWTPKYKVKSEVKPSDKDLYLCEMKGNVVTGVPLVESREVAKGRSYKREPNIFSSADPTQNRPSARINKVTGRTLDRGIQLYRLWFNFLKLALELEELKVSLVTKNPTLIKYTSNPNEPIPQKIIEKSKRERFEERGGRDSQDAGSNPNAIFRCRRIQKVKVKRSKYKVWDLDRVLTESFDDWWYGHEEWGFVWKKVGKKREREFIPNPDLNDEKRRGHSNLFEGHYPSIMESKSDWIDDPNFVYVRIDKTSQWTDVRNFMSEELSKQIKTDGRPRYKLSGKNPRVNVLQNNFNAIVLLIKGMSPKEICTAKEVYLRATDENMDSSRSKGERLTVSKDKKTGKSLYSVLVSKQREMGVHHLFEVCEGRFGTVKPTK